MWKLKAASGTANGSHQYEHGEEQRKMLLNPLLNLLSDPLRWLHQHLNQCHNQRRLWTSHFNV
jgi:hypothetical protein